MGNTSPPNIVEDLADWEWNQLAKAADALTNILRMIEGAKSSPDYPDNLPALLDEIVDEIRRVVNDNTSHVEKS